MSNAPRIVAVVLAAGRSTRMGANKLLADLNGKPLLATTLRQIEASGVEHIIVVTGHQADEVQAALKHTKAQFIHNPNYADGLSTSLRVCVNAVKDYAACFICLGDMPLIRAEDMQRMIAAFDAEEGRTLIAPVLGRKLGNPVLWGQAHFASLMSLEGDRGARSLLEANRDHIVEIHVEHDGILRDADTPEALAAIRKLSAV